MSRNYDNWERLVGAVIKKEQFRQMALAPPSRDTSFSSTQSHVSSFASSNRNGDHIRVGNSATGVIAGGVADPTTYNRRKKQQDIFFDVPAEAYLGHLKRFTLCELQAATDSFSYENLIGWDVLFTVYKGRLENGMLVAVKRLKEELPYTELEVETQFQTEVETISMAVHRNLQRLHGFCVTTTESLLVYPYMANGSVASYLRGRLESQPPLDWPVRKRIALGSAEGLTHLHEHCDQKIIHRDFHAWNVMLDEDFEVVVGNFRLSILMDHEDTHVTTDILYGTSGGYACPEYISTGKVSEKKDVFDYGIMLLELITGQSVSRLVSLANDEAVMLLDWVKELMKEPKKLEKLVDKDLKGNYIDEEVDHLIQVALLCASGSSNERPNMSDVVRMLGFFSSISHNQIAVGTSATRAIPGGVAAYTIARSYNPRKKQQDHFLDIPDEFYLAHLRRFSLDELQAATDSFSNENIIGWGGFGKVYKGRLADGTLVAVKRLQEGYTQDGELQLQIEEETQFQTELQAISMVSYRNLQRLHGFCMTTAERFLVYPYMANGSVASCLRGRPESQRPLDWPVRKRIAVGSAWGLAYLHEHCDRKIIHRDIKAANILLDDDFEAVVGEFGLAIVMDHKDTHVTTYVRGTGGYICPEYHKTGKLSEKADVFGYGIMLLELITGHKVFDVARLAKNEDVMLLDWVKGLVMEKKLEMLVDKDLKGDYINEEVEQLIQVALLCTQYSSNKRPNMSAVVRMLQGDGLAERWEEYQKDQKNWAKTRFSFR